MSVTTTAVWLLVYLAMDGHPIQDPKGLMIGEACSLKMLYIQDHTPAARPACINTETGMRLIPPERLPQRREMRK